MSRRKAARTPARRRHVACGLTGPGASRCRRCPMVDDYRARRGMYLDELEQLGRGDEPPPGPPVTFRWWLNVYEWSERP